MSGMKPAASNWRRKTLVVAIGAAMAVTVSLPAVAASTTVSTATTTPVSLTGTDTLNVTNTGSITLTGSAPAVSISGDTGITLTNDGTLSASGSGPGSVSVINVGGTLVGSISNTGTVSATEQLTSSSAHVYDVYLGSDLSSTGSITNSGSMTASATVSGSRSAYATGMYMYDMYGDVTNAQGGTITVSATSANGSASAAGIIIDTSLGSTGLGGASAQPTLTNAGTISATAHSGFNSTAYGIWMHDVYGDVTNAQGGTITASSTSASGFASAAGIYISSSLGSTGLGGASAQPTLTNAGTISATAQGTSARAIAIYDWAYSGNYPDFGAINNSGTLTATAQATSRAASAYGVYVGSSLEATGSITNSGSIAATATSNDYAFAGGVYVYQGLYGDVTNAQGGTITASATSANGFASAAGIYLSSSLGSTGLGGASAQPTLTNAGTISATAQGVSEGDAYAIYDSGSDYGAINNSGTLTATAQAKSGSASAYGVYVGYNVGSAGSIINSGSISATATSSGTSSTSSSASAYGIYVYQNVEAMGSITNSGSISATASTVDGDASAEGVYVYYSLYGDVLNDQGGTISVTASSVNGNAGAQGILAWTSLGDSSTSPVQGSVTNAGTISAKASVSGSGIVHATGISVQDTLYGTIANSGTITADASGAGSRVYAAGVGASTIDGKVINSGTISATATDPLNGYSVNATSGSGMVSNLGGGLLSGNLNLGGSITLSNAGTIALPEGAGAMVGGNFTQSSGGVLEIGASSTSSYSTLTVGGTATIAGTVQVDLAQGNTLALGDTLSGVVTSGTLKGNFSSVTSNNLLYAFTSAVNGNAIDLTMVKGITPTIAAQSTGNTPALGLAGRLDTIVYNPGMYPQFSGMTGKFAQMTSAHQLSNAESQLLPLFTGDSALMQSDLADTMNHVVGQRSHWGTGLSSGDATKGGTSFWVKPFASRATQDAKGPVPGYRSSMSGLMVGSDGQFSDSTRLGGSIAYAHARLDSKSDVALNSDQVYLMQLSGYGNTRMGQNSALNYELSYSSNKNSGVRNITFANRHAIARYTSTMLHAGLGYEYAMHLGDATRLVPDVRVDYTRLKDPSYYERGAGNLNLVVDGQTYKKLELGVGGRLEHDMSASTRLSMEVGAGYDTNNQQAQVTAALAGAQGLSFVTRGLKPSRVMLHAGVGVTSKLSQAVALTGAYNYAKQGGFHTQSLSLKVNWMF